MNVRELDICHVAGILWHTIHVIRVSVHLQEDGGGGGGGEM